MKAAEPRPNGARPVVRHLPHRLRSDEQVAPTVQHSPQLRAPMEGDIADHPANLSRFTTAWFRVYRSKDDIIGGGPKRASRTGLIVLVPFLVSRLALARWWFPGRGPDQLVASHGEIRLR